MTIGGWILFGFFTLCIIGAAIALVNTCSIYEEDKRHIPKIWVGAGVLIILIFAGMMFYYNKTASGVRAKTDSRSELQNGLDRVINVYTADGNLIAHYEGHIDLEDNAGGYVIFDYEGKRYTYYNCFVESIAEID